MHQHQGNRSLFYKDHHRGWNGDQKGDEEVISLHNDIKPFPSNMEAVLYHYAGFSKQFKIINAQFLFFSDYYLFIATVHLNVVLCVF